ncbi:MAG: DUF3810 domain-containing protein [Lacibacter sp.]
MQPGNILRLALFLTLLLMATGIFIASGWHNWIEINYSSGFYPPLARTLRFLLGWVPFSIGDLLYAAVLLYILWEIGLFLRNLLRNQRSKAALLQPLYKAVLVLLFVYVYFYLFWGLNYYRLGIEHQLGLVPTKPTASELHQLACTLAGRANTTKAITIGQKDTVMSRSRLFQQAPRSYRQLEQQFPFLKYREASIKPSLFGKLGNYVGFQGYYNPFTGEAQVNVRVPQMELPFVLCHELAHQLGYASESEANFVGFLAASRSTDTLMQYSAYLEMFMYAWGKLYYADSTLARQLLHELHPSVRNDIRIIRNFNRKYQGWLQQLTSWVYDYYLRQNRQTKGIDSYGEVTGWLLAYQKKYGRL